MCILFYLVIKKWSFRYKLVLTIHIVVVALLMLPWCNAFYTTMIGQCESRKEYKAMIESVCTYADINENIVVMATNDIAPNYSMSVQVVLDDYGYQNVYIIDSGLIVDFYNRSKPINVGGWSFDNYIPSQEVEELYSIFNYYPTEVNIINWDEVDSIIISDNFLSNMPEIFDINISVFDDFKKKYKISSYNNLVLLKR